ncbi:MAG: YkgJ family cysteine cluster protein [Oscillospiraceae bacterium]
MFKCDMCGECCRNVGLTELYRHLADETGACRYLNGNKCSIYAERPLLCRVDEGYELFFSDHISIEEYYRLNYEVCEILKANRRK